MKTLHLFFFAMMLLFTILQWNDPDRGYWILIYLAAAILAFIAFSQNCNACITAWAFFLILSCILMIIPTISGVITFVQNANLPEFFSAMQTDKLYIEQVREFSGLLIIILYCFITLYKTLSNRNKT